MDNSSLLNEFKGFLTGIATRWVLKIGGGFLLSQGVSEQSTTEIVTALVSIGVGLIISVVQHRKAIETPAPKAE